SVPATPGWCSIGGRSLPPTLYRRNQNTMTGCSKAPRGLSVLRRRMRILTHTTISPSLTLRQRSSRYTIRAGRNLPDKEFRSIGLHGFPRSRTLSFSSSIHRLGYSADLLHAFRRQMNPLLHQSKNGSELVKVHVLLCLQRVLDEKWNDALLEVIQPSNPVG